jgi:hypothetical protein
LFSSDEDSKNVTKITKYISDTTRREPARTPCGDGRNVELGGPRFLKKAPGVKSSTVGGGISPRDGRAKTVLNIKAWAPCCVKHMRRGCGRKKAAC